MGCGIQWAKQGPELWAVSCWNVSVSPGSSPEASWRSALVSRVVSMEKYVGLGA